MILETLVCRTGGRGASKRHRPGTPPDVASKEPTAMTAALTTRFASAAVSIVITLAIVQAL